jgi:SAM-dependent methyltransferase
MHDAAVNFLTFVKNILPHYFKNIEYLDVGAGDINGNLNHLFENCIKNANDVAPNKNITIICKTKDLPFPNKYFKTIISSECFEHDPTYKHSLLKIYDMLDNDGLFCFTCAGTGREEHGTRRTNYTSSLGALYNIDDMSDYYKNLTEYDLNEVLNLSELFSSYDTYYNKKSQDLYFIGIKSGNNKIILDKYNDIDTLITTENIKNNN